jgi:tryptophan 7-halogenase
VRTMPVPDSLQHKMDLWQSNARIFRENAELFSEISWVEVFLGQNIVPKGYDPMVDAIPEAKIKDFLSNVRSTIARCVEVMPTHAQFIAQHCAVPSSKHAMDKAAVQMASEAVAA